MWHLKVTMLKVNDGQLHANNINTLLILIFFVIFTSYVLRTSKLNYNQCGYHGYE